MSKSLKTIVYTPNQMPAEVLQHLTALEVDSIIRLVPEPDNPCDPHAIACYHGEEKIGYLLRPAQPFVERADYQATVYEKALVVGTKIKQAPKIILKEATPENPDA